MKNQAFCPKCDHAIFFDSSLLLSGGSIRCDHCDYKASLLDESKRLLGNTVRSIKERQEIRRQAYYASKRMVES
ncbi:MAG: hypothetical protein ACRBEE_07795 [Arenicella sp.]